MYIIKPENLGRILMLMCLLGSPMSVFTQNTEEEALTGREFLADCEQKDGSTGPTHACMQYVFGLVHTVVMLQQLDPGEKLFCIDPTVISLKEVTNSVTAWLKRVPGRLDEEAYVLVSEALNSAYPCSTADII